MFTSLIIISAFFVSSLVFSFFPSSLPLLLSPTGAGDEEGSGEDRADAACVHAAGGEDCLESSRGQALEVSEMGAARWEEREMGGAR